MRDSTNQTFESAARANQDRLASELGGEFDYIVCGSGSSGSVVAGRLAANPDVSVLLIEAAGSDETEMVLDTDRWPMNLGGELDWSFFTEPNPNLNGRSILYSMGKVFGRRFKHQRRQMVQRTPG
jgi:choline dehydrogenase